MPRASFHCHPESLYHLYARSNNRDWFAIPLEEVWTILNAYLYLMSESFGVRIQAFVLMNNHFHLLAQFPKGNLSEATNYLMRETSRVIGFESERINHVYGARIGRSRIDSPHYSQNVYKYVYRNPVAAGVAERVEDYPFSTLAGVLGSQRLLCPVADDPQLIEDTEATLRWLNTTPDANDWESVARALRRSCFQFSPDRRTRRPNRLEEQLL